MIAGLAKRVNEKRISKARGDQSVAASAGGANGAGTDAVSNAISVVSQYIPAEMLGFYITVLSLYQPVSNSQKWGTFFGCMAFGLVYTVLAHMSAVKRNPPPADSSRSATQVIGLFLLPVIAFTIWSGAMPNSPFESFAWFSPNVGAIAVVGSSILLPLISHLMDIPVANPDN